MRAYSITPQGHRAGKGWGGFADAGVSVTETDRAATVDQSAGSTHIVGTAAETDRSAYDPQPDGRRYAACGDGVVANVAEWIATRLAAVIAAEADERQAA